MWALLHTRNVVSEYTFMKTADLASRLVVAKAVSVRHGVFFTTCIRSLNPRQENVSWHRLAPHGRRKFCFRGWGTRNIKDSRGTAAGGQNSDDAAKYTGNMKWGIALLHIRLFCRSLVSNSCILTTCSECSDSIK